MKCYFENPRNVIAILIYAKIYETVKAKSIFSVPTCRDFLKVISTTFLTGCNFKVLQSRGILDLFTLICTFF